MYIKICNLVVIMTIHIPSPSLHNKVDSGSCHEDRIRNLFAVCVVHTSGQGGMATFPSYKQGQFSTCRYMQIPHAASRCSGISA
jgi:hypothetical protein